MRPRGRSAAQIDARLEHPNEDPGRGSWHAAAQPVRAKRAQAARKRTREAVEEARMQGEAITTAAAELTPRRMR